MLDFALHIVIDLYRRDNHRNAKHAKKASFTDIPPNKMPPFERQEINHGGFFSFKAIEFLTTDAFHV